MTRELQHIDGVGNNTRLAVIENGQKIGHITRNGNRGFDVFGHYARKLAFGTSLAIAKGKALAIDFPTVQEAYELACEEARQRRKRELERAFAGEVYRLSRALIAGSNSAREELENILSGIDAHASHRGVERGADPWNEVVMGHEIPLLPGWPKPPESYLKHNA